jgi:hypothetical protein
VVPLGRPPADQAAGQREEGVVEFEASFPSDGEAFELVEQGEGLLDDIAELGCQLKIFPPGLWTRPRGVQPKYASRGK